MKPGDHVRVRRDLQGDRLVHVVADRAPGDHAPGALRMACSAWRWHLITLFERTEEPVTCLACLSQ